MHVIWRLLALWLLAAVSVPDQCSAALQRCPEPVVTFAPDSISWEQEKHREGLLQSLKLDTVKNCLGMLREQALEIDQFYAAQINESIALETEVCATNLSELASNVDRITWHVTLRASTHQRPLYSPTNDLHAFGNIRWKIDWIAVELLSWSADYCMTSNGVLQVLRFHPKMAGTYRVNISRPSGVSSLHYFNQMADDLEKTLHHLDYVYSNDETFDGVNLREPPVLAPKASKRRMFTTEKNLRYQYRTPDTPLTAIAMDPVRPKEYRYPKEVFESIGIQMIWTPPPELHQFSDWKPSCVQELSAQTPLEFNQPSP